MPLDFLQVGAEPVAGYECLEDLGGTMFHRLWKVRAPDGALRLWKAVDLAVGNAAVETRTLEMLLKVRHPRLNTLVQYHTLADHKALVVETEAPTKSLRDRLKERQGHGHAGLAAEETVQWLAQAAEGLDYLNAPRHHFQGQQVAIYHRDLRPEVLLLFEAPGETQCKVSDFGLAKAVTDQNAQHSQGLVHFDYDPPEFYEGVTAPNSDQYSLAIVHYELRTGKLPFHGTMLEQLQARLEDRPDLSGLASARERQALQRALQKEPKKRYGNCRDFVAALAEALSAPDEPAEAQSSAEIAVAAPPGSGTGSGPRPFGGRPLGAAAAARAGSAAVAEAPRTASGFPPRTQAPLGARRGPPTRLPTVTELARESGEVDLTGILKGAPPAPRPAAAPATAAERLRAAQGKGDEANIPMFWVCTIVVVVFAAIALVVKEFVLGR